MMIIGNEKPKPAPAYLVYATWHGYAVIRTRSITMICITGGTMRSMKSIATFDDPATADAVCADLNRRSKP